jgi:hypothetical protein
MRDSLAFSVLFEFLVACKSYLPPQNLPMNAKIRRIISFAQGIVTLKQVRIRCGTSLSILYIDIDLLVKISLGRMNLPSTILEQSLARSHHMDQNDLHMDRTNLGHVEPDPCPY